MANYLLNDLYPERMADVARELEADGRTVEVLDVDDMQEASGWARCSALGRAPSTSRL